ncbi:MAG TPA: hypothetical protein DCZ63_15765, partial [Geobacter sp.]|nr:hypothetical protein [Geobacter sp.]
QRKRTCFFMRGVYPLLRIYQVKINNKVSFIRYDFTCIRKDLLWYTGTLFALFMLNIWYKLVYP